MNPATQEHVEDPRRCSRPQCRKILEEGYTKKQCPVCSESKRRTRLAAKDRKRKRDEEDRENSDEARAAPALRPITDRDIGHANRPLDSGDDAESNEVCHSAQVSSQAKTNEIQKLTPIEFDSGEALMLSLRQSVKAKDGTHFCGIYRMDMDPLVKDRERVQMVAHEVWKVSGYRFRYARLS